jgi:aminomethyltransferase
MEAVCDETFGGLAYFRSMGARIGNSPCLVSRTGYTGEDGFEVYMDSTGAAEIWDLFMQGRPTPQPCGLGARDSLRLEMAFRLHGCDMDESTTPFEAGLGWIVKLDKGEFLGKEALVRQKEQGPPRRLIGLASDAKRFPRQGHAVYSGDRKIGEVTSGGFAPSLGKGIALAYVETGYAGKDTEFKIDVRGQAIEAAFVKGPFYKKPKPKPERRSPDGS